MTMMRWDPLGEMTSLQQAVNQLLQDSVVVPRAGTRGGVFEVALDVAEEENGYRVEASLPGMKPEDVQINLQNNVLTISGELQARREGEQGRYHLAERRTGRFSRSIALPVAVDADGADAVFEHGVLTLTLPKAEQARRKQITVRSQEATATDAAQTRLQDGRPANGQVTNNKQVNGEAANGKRVEAATAGRN